MSVCRLLSPLVLVGILTASAGPGGLQAQRPQPDDGAYRGYLAVRLSPDGPPEVIDEFNADRLFVPASVLKVVTVAAALDHLGLQYTWRTRLVSNAAIRGNVLPGDLIIEPGADPTWGSDIVDDDATPPLTALAEQVRAKGVTEVTGDLVVDASRFPGRSHPTDRTHGDLPYGFGTPPAALAIDEATITVRVAPGIALGEPAQVTAPDDVEVLNHTTTVGRERHGAGTLDFIPVWGTSTLVLRGEYPISEAPFVVSATDPAPEVRVAHRLLDALAMAGVTVHGRVRVERRRPAINGQSTPVAEIRSVPLHDLLEKILTNSHNWYADMLALTLAREVAGSGRFDDGVEVISDFVDRTGPNDGDGPSGLWIRDGSGLSASNLVTPATVVRVLTHVRRQPWGLSVLDALAAPGTGTMSAWPRLPPLVAKTGTLRHTVSLAGIVDPEGDQPVVFCYFVNHHPNRARVARNEIASALTRWRATSTSR